MLITQLTKMENFSAQHKFVTACKVFTKMTGSGFGVVIVP